MRLWLKLDLGHVGRWAERPCSPLVFAILVVVLSAAMYFASGIRSSTDVLADGTWGAGRPSASAMAAIALGRPWWRPTRPEPVVVREDGAIEPLVRIPRSDIVTRWDCKSLPIRGIGYYLFGAAIVALRSVCSDDLVFDFVALLRIQDLLLEASLAAALTFLWRSTAAFRTNAATTAMVLSYLALLVLRPNGAEYLNQGIVDSALANPLAILAVPALAFAAAAISGRSRWGFVACSLFFGYAMLVRAEFLIVFLVSCACVTVVVIRKATMWQTIARAALVVVLGLLLPVGYGFLNLSVFGHFVPLRMQAGQNLVEPIGQYPNPYGIVYSDEWIGEYLADRGIAYLSFEADEMLTAWYVEILRDNPQLLIHNCVKRLSSLPMKLTAGLNLWTLPVVLVVSIRASRRSPTVAIVSLPLWLITGFLLFHGWFNSLPRLVTPVHFLATLWICFLVTHCMVLATARIRRSSPPAESTYATGAESAVALRLPAHSKGGHNTVECAGKRSATALYLQARLCPRRGNRNSSIGPNRRDHARSL